MYAFTIYRFLAPLPTREKRGSVSTVQSVLDRMSRNLQGDQRTVEMNPSLEIRSEIPSDKYNQIYSAIGTVTWFLENSIEQQSRTAITTTHLTLQVQDQKPMFGLAFQDILKERLDHSK